MVEKKKKKGLVWGILGGLVAVLAIFGLVKKKKTDKKG